MPRRGLMLHYVLSFATMGAFIPYLQIYGEQRGMTDTQLGLMGSLSGLAALFVPMVYTALADRVFSNRVLLAFCYGLSGIAMLWVLGASEPWSIIGAKVMFAVVFSSSLPLLDGLTFTTLQHSADMTEGAALQANPDELNDPHTVAKAANDYRDIRIWGSYGWMIPGMLLPVLVIWTLSDLWVSRIAIGMAVVFAILGTLTARTLPAHGPAHKKGGVPTGMALKKLLTGRLLWFIVAMLLMMMAQNMFFMFYPLVIRRLEIPTAWLGLVINIGVVAEIVLMFFVGWMLKRWSLRAVMVAGFVSQVIRALGVALVPTAPMAIATQVLHGPTVLAFALLAPMYLNRHAEASYRNSVQGVYMMICYGVSRIVGPILGGWVSDGFGGGLWGLQITFAVSAVLTGLGVVVMMAAMRPDRGTAVDSGA